MSENMTQLLAKLAAVTERAEKAEEEVEAMKLENGFVHMHKIDDAESWKDRAESAEEELLAVREDNHSMMLEIDGLRTERDALASELAKLRAQEPVAYLDYWKSDGTGIVRKQRTTGVPFFNSPVPAPAVPAPTPFLPDADTRRNDAEFAAQQEVGNAPSVPDEWRTMLQWLIGQRGKAGHCHSRPGVWDDDNGDKAGQPCEQCAMYDRARVLLQSADHSEHVLEKVAPDCLTCANIGLVNGLSQESYCDSCIYQGRDWRQNHFVDAHKMVDAGKRRCEACAILPCSCK